MHAEVGKWEPMSQLWLHHAGFLEWLLAKFSQGIILLEVAMQYDSSYTRGPARPKNAHSVWVVSTLSNHMIII